MPSSVISYFNYDGDTETLRVVYVSGMVYDYKKVPLEVYQAMKASFSKGTFLNKYVKGNFEFEKVD
ncbi:hypothetical protein DYBT9623_01532 [Dyadobacter sp. CECT 9623]|jgi:hypothetical protein|uniref:KTSC domain-containing protein n=1 Tax=Dyadobacter linearis TaxID=2823330 RepID=A0ABN7R3S9_9BACT|nr:KTSC domain-containing protein [Dyadobacter sp. CECT 9623]CAG5068800.1 hypothetical protein DYBT9623_01532 [Dyadobacter sp. CECT 9623]